MSMHVDIFYFIGVLAAEPQTLVRRINENHTRRYRVCIGSLQASGGPSEVSDRQGVLALLLKLKLPIRKRIEGAL